MRHLTHHSTRTGAIKPRQPVNSTLAPMPSKCPNCGKSYPPGHNRCNWCDPDRKEAFLLPGYTCKTCGATLPDGRPCPYCTVSIPSTSATGMSESSSRLRAGLFTAALFSMPALLCWLSLNSPYTGFVYLFATISYFLGWPWNQGLLNPYFIQNPWFVGGAIGATLIGNIINGFIIGYLILSKPTAIADK